MTPAGGQVIGGKYRLERPLAEGGMGVVWIARHIELDVEVALKFISDQDSEGADRARARFKREAKAAAQLKSPYVAHVYDYGVEQSMPYIAMEMLEGQSLAEFMEHHGPLSPLQATPLVEQLCRGLQAAHAKGIVHRDLKPSNVFIARMEDQEVVKILDFGIAKLTGTRLERSERTKSGVVLGSPFYMSPEQAEGSGVDGRTDLWAAAVLLFEMLTGSNPFERDYLEQSVVAVCAGPLPVPSDFAPSLSAQVDRFFEIALARAPAGRFQTAPKFSEAFAAVAAGGPVPEAELSETAQYSIDPSLQDRQAASRQTESAGQHTTTQLSPQEAFAPTEAVSSKGTTTGGTIKVVSAAAQPDRKSTRKIGLWVPLATAVVSAVIAWMVARQGQVTSPPNSADGSTGLEKAGMPGSAMAGQPPTTATSEPNGTAEHLEQPAGTSDDEGSAKKPKRRSRPVAQRRRLNNLIDAGPTAEESARPLTTPPSRTSSAPPPAASKDDNEFGI